MVYVIDHRKVIESMNVTFDDNKLLSIQIKDTCNALGMYIIVKLLKTLL